MINNNKKKKKMIRGNKKQNRIMLLFILAVCFVIFIVCICKPNNVVQNGEFTKQEFLDVKNKIELKIANELLDGSVVDSDTLEDKIDDLNDVLKAEDWDKLNLDNIPEIDGVWSLDGTGKLKFEFNSSIPDWTEEENIKEYIIEK